jgi:vancomycin resistance protein YoaR
MVPARRPVTGRRALLAAAGAAGLLAALYGAAWAAVGSGVARGTTVLGVPIGGLSVTDATRTLDRELADEAAARVVVAVGPREVTVDPSRAGLALDPAATVASAPSRSWNPVELVDALVGGDEVAPVAAVDRAALSRAVDRLAERLDRPAVDGRVRFSQDGAVRTVAAQVGIRVRRAAAREALPAGYLTPAHAAARPVRLPAEVDQPAVTQDEVDRVAVEVAGPAVAGPVPVTVEATTARLEPQDIADSLTFVPDAAGALQPQLDGERLHAALGDDLAGVEEPARDATFDVSSGRPTVVPSEQGREVLPATLGAAVLPALTVSGPARAVAVPLEVSDPEVGTAEARALGVSELVSEYTTYYPSDFAPRLTNIHRAADLMDGTLVLPDEVFSLNRTVGERTAERGFAAGFIINDGRLEVDYGGGVSQLATTTFNAAFFAGLDIVEHHPHSFYISRYPEGRESTVAWGYKDVRIRNDSGNGVFLTTSYTSSSVTVRVWGTKRYRIEATKGPRYDVRPFTVEYDPRPEGTEQGDCVSTEGVPGFRVVVSRLFYEGGKQVRSEEFRTRYNPENEVRCGSSGPAPPEGTEPD